MEKQRLSLEEFKALFPNGFESEDELQREYDSFLSTFEQLDKADVPELSYSRKMELFRKSWQKRPQRQSWIVRLVNMLRQPAMTFILGIVVGCILNAGNANKPIDITTPASAKAPLEIDHTRYSQTYKGKIIDDFYSDIENPTIVREAAGESEPPQTTLYGTLDDGEIYIVWNL